MKHRYASLTILTLFYFFTTHAQNIKGVTKIYPDKQFPLLQMKPKSFIKPDSYGNVWIGQGAYYPSTQAIVNGTRAGYGLVKMSNGQSTRPYTTGVFADALEDKGTVYFAAYDGLYMYDGSAMTVNNTPLQNTSLAMYKSVLYIGSMGNGVYEKNGNTISTHHINIGGVNYDSVYSMSADNNYLWIGTRKGLVRYDGNTFTAYPLPFKNTYTKLNNDIQKIAFCVQTDGYGNVWVANAGGNDSVDCLYRFRNNTFTAAKEIYSNLCRKTKLISYRIDKLSVNAEGNIMFGNEAVVTELTPDDIRPYFLVFYYSVSSGLPVNLNSFPRWSFAVCGSDGKVYASQTDSASVRVLDRSQYSLDAYIAQYHNLLYNNVVLRNLDINNIKAACATDGTLFDDNRLFCELGMESSFDIPSKSCARPMFTSALWLGGIDKGTGQARVAVQTYKTQGAEYYPGPVDTATFAYDADIAAPYNKIWKTDRLLIETFKQNFNKPGYTIPEDILTWPAHGTGNFSRKLAPFVDVNSNGIYEPAQGDYPEIKGDQMLWWVFNEMGPHNETGGPSMNIEVQASAYAYYYIDLPDTDSNGLVNNTVFFDYKIINRGVRDYKNFRAALFTDPDLGNYSDDYIGCDTINNAGFVYNADDNDEGRLGFGKNPPAVFCKMLNHKMAAFNSYDNTNNPVTVQHYYNMMNGLNRDGNIIQYQGSGPATTFLYSGDICDNVGWTESSAGNQPGDRRFLMASESQDLKAKSVYNLEFTYIFDYRPELSYNDSTKCERFTSGLKRIQSWFDKQQFPSKPAYGTSVADVVTERTDVLLFPNPAAQQVVLRSAASGFEQVEIYDMAGKLVLHSTIDNIDAPLNHTLDISTFPQGIYIVKVQSSDGKQTVKKLVKQ